MKRLVVLAFVLMCLSGCTQVSLTHSGPQGHEATPESTMQSLHVVSPTEYDGKLYVLKKQSGDTDETVMTEIELLPTRAYLPVNVTGLPSKHMPALMALVAEFETKTGRRVPPGGIQFLDQEEAGSIRDNGKWSIHQYDFTFGMLIDHMPSDAYELTYHMQSRGPIGSLATATLSAEVE